jgi:hypothetical protein
MPGVSADIRNRNPPNMSLELQTTQTRLVKAYKGNKVKLPLCLTNYALRHEDVWGSGFIDSHFLDLGTNWKWVVSFTLRPLYLREWASDTHCIGGLVDPRASLGDMEKWKFLTLAGLEVRPLSSNP